MNKPMDRSERRAIDQVLDLARAGEGAWRDNDDVRHLAVAGLAGLVIALLAWAASPTRSTVRYVTEPVTRGNLTVIVTATGTVQPTKKVDVSSELSGTVRKVLVDYNSPVKRGQTLAELDTDKLNATVESSRARLAAVRARVAEANATVTEKERDLERKRVLVERQAGPAYELDTARAAHDRAKAQLASAQADVGVAAAELKLNETNLAKACICSPIDGVVLKRAVDPGQTVASSLQAPVLFSIAEDLTQMELQVDVDEADVGKVKAGQKASFSVDAFPERRFPATIRDVRYASETIQGVVTYKALLAIENSELLLRPGMTATAEIAVTEVADALLVPNAALRYQPPANGASRDTRSFLERILPGRPPFREASRRNAASDTRQVWRLDGTEPAPVEIFIGPSDGRRTVMRKGALEAGQRLVVDRAAAAK